MDTLRCPLNPVSDSCAGRNRQWQALAFVPLSTSSPLTKVGIIYMYTQVQQEENIFPMIARSGWSAQWSLRYAQKYLEISVKNWGQNFLQLHLAILLLL